MLIKVKVGIGLEMAVGRAIAIGLCWTVGGIFTVLVQMIRVICLSFNGPVISDSEWLN